MIAKLSLERYQSDGFVIANASQTIADTEVSIRGQRSERLSLWSPNTTSSLSEGRDRDGMVTATRQRWAA